ncbi:MAG: DUF3302 domain-containing protein [Rhizobiaceae bacterium]
MTGLDIAAIVMLLFMAVLGVIVIWFLGSWPGRAAASRNHPYQKSITVGGWVTLIAGGVFWPVVLIWAYAGHPDSQIEKSSQAGETTP